MRINCYLKAIILFIISCVTVTNAQTEGFEGTTFPPSGWTSQSVSGAVEWTRSTSTSHSGDASAFISYDGGGGEDWLITPLFSNIEASDTLSFWVRKQYSSNYPPDFLEVKVSTTTNDIASFSTTLASINVNSLFVSWSQLKYGLSAFAGEDIYIAFRHYDTDGNGMFLDDVFLGVPPVPLYEAEPNDLYSDNSIKTINEFGLYGGTVTDGDRDIWYITQEVSGEIQVDFTYSGGGTVRLYCYSNADSFDYGTEELVVDPGGTETFTAVPGNFYSFLVFGAAGIPAESEWTFTISSNGGALPVELSSFNAVTVNSDIILNWQTSTEKNNYGFEIERKSSTLQQGKGDFEKIGFIKGAGNSSLIKEYSFTDKNLTGHNYKYRLKQIDNDGSFSYSEILEVSTLSGEYSLEQNYPNPFNPTTKINFGIPELSYVELKVYNILGKEVSTLVNEQKQAGKYSIDFNAFDLASGVYFFRLTAGSFSETRSMMLSK